jgi:hypothetical protein
MNHSFPSPSYHDTKCYYCGKKLSEVYTKGYGNKLIFIENPEDRPPCLTDDEYVIKSIIE